MQSEADRLVLAEHGPPAPSSIRLNIVQVRGRTAPYLELSPGEPSHQPSENGARGLIAVWESRKNRPGDKRVSPKKDFGLRPMAG